MILNTLPNLAVTEAATQLGDALIAGGAVPHVAARDAVHVGTCAVHGVRYLLTWNCTHLANAQRRSKIDEGCRAAGYEPPVICTPDELIGGTP